MPPSWPASLAALVRLPNLLIAAAGVAVGGFLAIGGVAWPASLLWAMGAALLIGASGNATNDLADLEADRINRPARPLPSGALSPGTARLVGGFAGGFGLAAAWLTGREVFAIGLVALLIMLVYSPLLKQFGVAGNVAVAVVASLPLVFGAAAAGWWKAGLWPALIAAVLHLAREVVKDLEDVEGDRAEGRSTLPLVRGARSGFLVAAVALIAFVPLSLLPWFDGMYGNRYGITVIVLDVGIAVLIARLLAHQLSGASLALKVAMVAGLAALLWDRL